MYEILRGPLVWVAFIALLGGAIYNLWRVIDLPRKDKVTYAYMDVKFSLRSILHWIVPFASHNMRTRPVMTVVAFAFHVCLLATPLLLLAHNELWHESWGVRLPSVPGLLADGMTLVVVFGGLFFVMRRVTLPVVAYVTDWTDYVVLLIAIAPFVTGFIAARGWFAYDTIIVMHIVSGVVWLAAIPFTRLTHLLYFVFTRAFMGCEFGAVRNTRDW